MSIREEIYERFQSGFLENKTVGEICKILNTYLQIIDSVIK